MKRKLFNYVLIVIIMVSVVLSMCGCGNTAEQNDKYNDKYLELLREGDQALSAGNFEDALSAYQQAIELSPAVPQAYHRMFDTYVRDERFDDALHEDDGAKRCCLRGRRKPVCWYDTQRGDCAVLRESDGPGAS